MESTLISVIIPIYNDELYLHDALQSIQQQTHTHFECLCVNDGSTDKSESIIDEFVNNDKRFIKINQENGGVSVARNTGLEKATGEYVYMMDHDDLTPAYTLEKLLLAAQKHDADLVRGRMMMIPENFKLEQLPTATDSEKSYYYDNPLSDYYRHMRYKNKKWYYIWMCLYKREVVKDIRFVDQLRSGGEDLLFTFEVVGKIKNFVQITNIVACHRYSKISTTLNGYNPTLFFGITEIVIPYIYKKYIQSANIDKRLIRWVYKKEAYAAYRFLIRNPIREYDMEHLLQAKKIILNHQGSEEFNEIIKYWNYRQRFFYMLLVREKFKLIKSLELFM